LQEYANVLARQELGIRKGVRQQLLQLVRSHSYIVTPSRRLEVAGDPDDNMFLECADAAKADYLVTGNQKHFPRFWKKTKIITAREFISLAAPHLVR
jgi:putative PIN family toxin of toxin-antitoxin system